MCHSTQGGVGDQSKSAGKRRRNGEQIQRLLQQFMAQPGLPFHGVLTDEEIGLALDEAGATNRVDAIYDHETVLRLFVAQVMDPDCSCAQAVTKFNEERRATGIDPVSTKTGAYCQGRLRLPEQVPYQLMVRVGEALEEMAPEQWKWCGRRVVFVDGTGVTMADTPANQAQYPQHCQKPGLGFPSARVVSLFGLASGAVLDTAIAPMRGKRTGETTLFRGMWHRLKTWDVVVGDEVFCSFANIALLQARGVDVVFVMDVSRHVDWSDGQQLGTKDHIVEWPKPRRCPEWMDRETYESLPDKLRVRELSYQVKQKGCRKAAIIVATTMLDPKPYPKRAIAELPRLRWHSELDLRSLKVTMHMDHLWTQTPAMVRKDIFIRMLAYNLVRKVQAQSGQQRNRAPREISVKGTIQHLVAYHPFVTASPRGPSTERTESVCEAIASLRVGDRSGRFEPRAVKRRPKHYTKLRYPRQQARRWLEEQHRKALEAAG